MANIFSVDSLARRHADSTLRGDIQVHARRRCEYDFKVTGFNASTVATIALVALSIFTGSILVFALAALAYSVRGAFLKSIMLTGAQENLVGRLMELDPEEAREETAEYLGIADDEWQMTHSQVLNFKVWMNWAPAQQQEVQAPQQPHVEVMED